MIQNSKIVGASISNDIYLRQEPGVSRGHPEFIIHRSELMMFASCPSRWLAGYTFKESDATFFGSLFDCLLTAPEQFDARYVEQPKTVTATKLMACVQNGDAEVGDQIPWQKCKEATAWKRKQKDKIIVPSGDMEEARQAVKRFTGDPQIKELLDCSKKQVMCIAEYYDEATGLVIPTKCLIDIVPDKLHRWYGTALGDIKTIRNAAHKQWLYAIDDRDYDAQGAFNLDHYNAATGEKRTSFLFPLCENVFPFEPARRFIEEPYIEEGRKKYLAALRLYCQCLKTNKWPGFDDDSPWQGWTLCEPDQRHSNFKRL